MSQPIRYGLADEHLGRIHPAKDGHLVMWADYAALAAENERLRKAGDAMAGEIIGCYLGEGYDPKDSDTLPLWNAAKEGRDAK